MVSPLRSDLYGGNGGNSFDESHVIETWGRITLLVVRHSDYVNGIGVGYENGNYFDRGGTAGDETRIVLASDEWITWVDLRSGVYLDQIKFTTNKGTVYGPYGGGGGSPHSIDFGGKALLYLFGRSGALVDQIGFGFGDQPAALPSSVTRSGPWGGDGGNTFDDLTQLPFGKIKSLTVRSGAMVDNIAVEYKDGPKCSHGGTGGNEATFTLDDDEWLTEVRGRSGTMIDQVQFFTSKGRVSPIYGGTGGDPWTAAMDGQIIKAFFGRSGAGVDRLGVYFENARPLSVFITDLTFNMDQAKILEMTPVAMMTTNLENQTGVAQQIEQKVSVAVTNSSKTTITETHGVSVEAKFSKEFNTQLAGKFTFEVTLGYKYEHAYATETGVDNTLTNEFTFTASVPPNSSIKATCMARKDTFDIPWTATAQVTYADRAQPVTMTLHGVLSGVQTTSLDAQYESVPQGSTVNRAVAGGISLMSDGGKYVCAEDGGGGTVDVTRTVIGPWETFTLVGLAAPHVALQASNGQFVCAEGGGGSTVVANRTTRGAWETFTLVDRGGGKVAFQTCNGHYLGADGGGGGPLVAAATAVGTWETFRRVRVIGRISLMTDGGKYVCAEGGGGGTVDVTRTAIGPWETFTLLDLGDGSVALQASNGQYVSAEGGGGSTVVANRTAVGPWETFTLLDRGGGKVALRTYNGHYLCAEGGGGGALVADRTAVGPWETFSRIQD